MLSGEWEDCLLFVAGALLVAVAAQDFPGGPKEPCDVDFKQSDLELFKAWPCCCKLEWLTHMSRQFRLMELIAGRASGPQFMISCSHIMSWVLTCEWFYMRMKSHEIMFYVATCVDMSM